MTVTPGSILSPPVPTLLPYAVAAVNRIEDHSEALLETIPDHDFKWKAG